MAWKKSLIKISLLSLFGCASLGACEPDTRRVTICRIDESIAHCSRNGKSFKKRFPAEMDLWKAWPDEGMTLLAERIEECKQEGHLDPTQDTIADMEVCTIGASCKDSDLQGHFATDPDGMQKIKSFLIFCGEHPVK